MVSRAMQEKWAQERADFLAAVERGEENFQPFPVHVQKNINEAFERWDEYNRKQRRLMVMRWTGFTVVAGTVVTLAILAHS